MKRTVAIVGRPNVGKSALFNRLVRKQISLVYDQPGVTRDRVMMDCEHRGRPFVLIDTGGIGLEDESGFEEAIENEVSYSLAMATDLLFVVDGREGIHPLDELIADRLRHLSPDNPLKQRIFLVVNKMDTGKQDDEEYEFSRLGFKRLFPVSSAHGRGIQHLLDELTGEWEEEPEAGDQESDGRKAGAVNVAIVGRPNAGKSSLINSLLNEQRVIVSPIAGTTRDAVDVHFVAKDVEYCLVDTAGMRKKRRIDNQLEQAMASRSAHSINRADICLLVLDASIGISSQEKKIAGLIEKAEKPCIVVVNKWDLAAQAHEEPGEDGKIRASSPEEFRQQYEKAVRRELFFLHHAPLVFTSALKDENLDDLIESLDMVRRVRETDIPGGPLNRVIENAMTRHRPHRGEGVRRKQRLKIFYVTQDRENRSTIALVAFLNHRDLWTDDYQRYLDQAVRKRWPLPGCPLVWVLRDKPDVRKKSASRRENAPKNRPARAGKKSPRKRKR
jgi:GTP-binding protein